MQEETDAAWAGGYDTDEDNELVTMNVVQFVYEQWALEVLGREKRPAKLEIHTANRQTNQHLSPPSSDQSETKSNDQTQV